MKITKKIFGLFLIALFSLLIIPSKNVFATNLISDSAELLTTEEAAKISDRCDIISQKYDTSVFIITSNKIGKSDDFENYMEKQSKIEDATKNLVILFVSTKKNGHVYQIHGYGSAKTYLTKERLNSIMDDMNSDLKSKKYYDALETFYQGINHDLGTKPIFDSFIFNPLFHLILSIILGVAFVFFILFNRAARNTTNFSTYLNDNNSKLLGKIDHFTHITITRTPRAKNDNDSSDSNHSSGDAHTF